jgi:hypothetical protein
MEPIKITFLEPFADGLRRLTINSWSGVCIALSRNRLDSALATGKLAHPGVYILVGPSRIRDGDHGQTLDFKLYIGKSDSLDERIALHNRSKDFWSAAFLFYRDGEEQLHAGQTGALEARLIARVRHGGNEVVNIATPEEHETPGDFESTGAFLDHIETVLAALGYNFFTSQTLPGAATLESIEEPAPPGIAIPNKLQRIISKIEKACLALESTEFYETQVPDMRAKVVSGEHFRVYALLRMQKSGVKLVVKNKPEQAFLLGASDSLSDETIGAIKTAHSRAMGQLAQPAAT